MILSEVDSLSISLLTDNYTDRLLPTLYPATRAPMIRDDQFLPPPPPVAEHGFSAYIKATSYFDSGEAEGSNKTSKENIVLFDCGTSENGVIHNANILGIDLKSIHTIILSHGHFDHFTGLINVIKKINKPVRLVCHPDAFLRRWIVFPDRKDKSKLPFLDREELLKHRVNIICKDGPSQISEYDIKDFKKSTISEYDPLSPKLLITGQIPRNTFYEKGFPLQYKEDINDNNVLIHDPLVNDDQSLVANIRNKGLVIISGCAHAGIINTVNYAKLLTGINKVFVIVGGFHLTGGKMYEEAIDPTISELKKINPDYLVPCHCTGWKATNRIIQELPDKFLQPSVCTTFTFESTL